MSTCRVSIAGCGRCRTILLFEGWSCQILKAMRLAARREKDLVAPTHSSHLCLLPPRRLGHDDDDDGESGDLRNLEPRPLSFDLTAANAPRLLVDGLYVLCGHKERPALPPRRINGAEADARSLKFAKQQASAPSRRS